MEIGTNSLSIQGAVFGRLRITAGRAEFEPIGRRDDGETWLSVKEATAVYAAASGRPVTFHCIYRLIPKGRLVVRRLDRNGGTEITLSSLEAYLEREFPAV